MLKYLEGESIGVGDRELGGSCSPCQRWKVFQKSAIVGQKSGKIFVNNVSFIDKIDQGLFTPISSHVINLLPHSELAPNL